MNEIRNEIKGITGCNCKKPGWVSKDKKRNQGYINVVYEEKSQLARVR